MSELERRRMRVEGDESGSNPDTDGGAGAELEAQRQDGDDLLRAGDAIIRGALSRNSVAFLHNSRQRGGQ